MKSVLFEFTKVSESLPIYGEPVLIRIGSTVQYITYTLCCDDNIPEWFEPFHFGGCEDLNVHCNKVNEWAYIADQL